MKTKLFLAALAVIVMGFNACGGGDDPEKSSEKQITSFKVNGVEYNINPTTREITYIYPKPSAGQWPSVPTWPQRPVITKSEKATISPLEEVGQDFIAAPVTYTVTAEDGTYQTYTVKAEKSQTISQ